MKREEIIRMAREAGFYVDEKARQNQPNCISHTYHMIDSQLERFATLVAAHVRETEFKPDWNNYQQGRADGAAEEREACAKVCDEYSAVGKIEEFDRGWLACAKAISNIIRARGQS